MSFFAPPRARTSDASFPGMDRNTARPRAVATRPPATAEAWRRLQRVARRAGAGRATPARRRRAPVRRSRAPPRMSGGRGGTGLLLGCRVDGETTRANGHGRDAEDGERERGTHPAPSSSRSNASSLRNIGASVRVARAHALRGLRVRPIAGRLEKCPFARHPPPRKRIKKLDTREAQNAARCCAPSARTR